MIMGKTDQDPFTVNVDLSGNGIELGLLVIPQGSNYTIKLDRVVFADIQYLVSRYPNWQVISGKVDEAGTRAIGKAIENEVA